MKWRRYRDSGTWHFNEKCFDWPTEDYVEVKKEPRDGYICEMCCRCDELDDGYGYDKFEFEREANASKKNKSAY